MEFKAENTDFTPDGIIWSTGKHKIYVNGKPSTIYVPPESILPTYQRLVEKGSVPLGIDHLSDEVIAENKILAKMNLLDVGKAKRFGTDGKNIYLLEGEVTNQTIQELGLTGELPSYSSVGRFKSTECERQDVDYVVTELDINRVDFVEQGGCRVCKVGSQPDELILTSKLHHEVKEMVEKTNTPEVSTEEEVIEAQTSEVETPQVEVVEPETPDPRMDELEAKMNKVLDWIGSQKEEAENNELEAQKADIKTAVEGYLKAGKAIPSERLALEKIALKEPELFKELMASRPKILKFEQLSEAKEPEVTINSDEGEKVEVDELTGAPILDEKKAKELADQEL